MSDAAPGRLEGRDFPLDARVVWLRAPGELEFRVERLDAATLGPRELLCETLVTAISPGTEVAAWQGLPPLRPGVVYPRLQGYCNVGRVIATGAEVSGLRCGDRILSFTSHRSHFRIGVDEVLLRLDADARAEDVVCTYLYHLGYNAVLRSDVRAGSSVLVLGVGVLGLTSVAVAALAGAEVVAMSSRAEGRERALACGARAAIAADDPAALQAALPPGGADVVVSTSNSWRDWALALRAAGRFATIACLGFPGRGQPPADFNPLDSQYFYSKQLTIRSVGLSPEREDSRGFLRFNERSNLQFLARRIADGTLQPSRLVSGEYPGTRIQEAYERLAARAGSPLTFLLRWNP